MKDKEIEFVIFDPAVSPSQDWELYKRLYIDPYPEKQIILHDTVIEYPYNKKTPKKQGVFILLTVNTTTILPPRRQKAIENIYLTVQTLGAIIKT